MNFQAAVTAIAQTYIVRHKPLAWLSGIENDTPISLSAETSGAGDDLQLEYRNGKICEIQIKKGLRKGDKLWTSIVALANAIHAEEIDYGVIVICPNSSRTISSELAEDIRRIASGRDDNLKAISQELVAKLKALKLPPQDICRKLRVVTVNALHDNSANILAAKAELEHICQPSGDTEKAWNEILKDSSLVIENRLKRTSEDTYRLLKSIGIENHSSSQRPSAIEQQAYRNWVMSNCSRFGILGLSSAVSIDDCWLPLNAMPMEITELHEQEVTLDKAVQDYHDWNQRDIDRHRDFIDPETIGRFYKLNVLIGGPGMGKSTLLKKLACIYSSDEYLVLRVNLRAVCARMISEGASFRESIFALGTDGYNGNPSRFMGAETEKWVMLFDGLDECGSNQAMVVEGLQKLASGFPDYRIIVATRPVGYSANSLSEWRHYELTPFATDDAGKHIKTLISAYLRHDDVVRERSLKMAEQFLKTKPVKNLAIRSPLLIGLISALCVRGKKPGNSKTELFDSIFSLIEARPSARGTPVNISRPILKRTLDILGYLIISHPLSPTKELISKSKYLLVKELQWPELKAEQIAEDSLQHWSGIGVVEQLSCGLDNTTTFIHKSFSEYSAARYVQSLPTESRSKLIEEILDKDEWAEVVRFLAGLGDGEFLIECIVKRKISKGNDFERAIRVLDILHNSSLPDGSDAARVVIENSVKQFSPQSRIRSYKLGNKLVEISSRYPSLVSGLTAPLISHEKPSMQLLGWASLVSCAGSTFDTKTLKLFLKNTLPKLMEPQMKASLGGGTILGSANHDLIQALIVRTTERVIASDGARTAVEFIPDSIRSRATGSVGLHIQLEHLFKDYDQSYILPSDKPAFGRDIAESFRRSSEARKEFITEHFPNLLDVKLTLSDSEKTYDQKAKLYNLAGFFKLSDSGSEPIYDARSWQEDYNKNAAREVVQAYVEACKIPSEALKAEAIIYIAMASQLDDSELFGLYRNLPEVDVPSIDWDNFSGLNIDAQLIEEAMYHGSEWLRKMATYVLFAITPKENLKSVIARLLAKGRGFTLRLACHLAGELSDADAIEIFHHRLLQTDEWGCEYIFNHLEKIDMIKSQVVSDVCAQGLFSQYAETAKSSAKLAASKTPVKDRAFKSLLEKAYDFWKVNEKPYPNGGGVVPASPRNFLLEAIEAFKEHDYTQLMEYLSDSRSDVRDFGIDRLIVLLGKNAGDRENFVRDTMGENISGFVVKKVFEAGVIFSGDSLLKLSKLIDHDNPRLRYASLELLEHPNLPAAIRTNMIEKAINDSELQIVDRTAYLTGD